MQYCGILRRDFRWRFGELSINEEHIIETEEKVANLKNLAAIIDRNAGVNIKKELKERKNQLTKLKAKNTHLRTKLGQIGPGI